MRHVLLAALLICTSALLTGCGEGGGPTTEKQVTITVDSKERGGGRDSEGNKDPALVWATHEDGKEETFKIEDNFLTGAGDSANVYGRLTVGETFTCTARGYRSASWYHTSFRNLFDCKPVEDTP